VSIVRAGSYHGELTQVVRRILSEHRVDVAGKRVLLKPNLVEFDASVPINTNPLFVLAVYEAFVAEGAASVRIAEGPGHRQITLDIADAAGYYKAVPRFEEVFVDLNVDDVVRVPLKHARTGLKELYLPKTIFDCDLFVSLPKMKTHHWVGVTLSSKNLFGVVPSAIYGWPKNLLHWVGIGESIADLRSVFRDRNMFAIVDGIDAMQGNGPIQGTLKHAGVLVAGRDFTAVDATCCRIMGVDPEKVEYLCWTGSYGQMDPALIEQRGEPIAAVQSDFELMEMWSRLRLA
jgi:uncharacterized protein (DUF362 family)